MNRRIKEISKMWIAGWSSVEIAERFGFKNSSNAASTIGWYRKRYPELFPYRKKWHTPRSQS